MEETEDIAEEPVARGENRQPIVSVLGHVDHAGTVGLVNRMDERATLQRLAKEVEGLRARHTQIGGQLEQVDAVLSEHTVTEAVLKALVQQPSAVHHPRHHFDKSYGRIWSRPSSLYSRSDLSEW